MPLPRLGAQPSAEDQAHECFCCSLKERRSQGAFCIQRLLWDYYFSFLPSSSLGSPFCSPSLSQHNSVCALSNLNLFSLMRRPLVSLLPKAPQPYPSPFAATPFFLLLSPSASLPRGTEVLPTHTLFLYHHFLLPLPLPPTFTSCFCFTSGQLGKIWAPSTHKHQGADLLLWDT